MGEFRNCRACVPNGICHSMSLPKPSQITLFPAVNAAIRDEKGRVLLTRRSQIVREPGLWCLPGGHLDPGETWYEGCLREVREEVGLKVEQGVLLGIYSDPLVNTVPHPKAPGGWGQFVAAVFVFEKPTQEPTPNEEVSEMGWFFPSEAPEELIVSHRIRLADLAQFKGAAFFR